MMIRAMLRTRLTVSLLAVSILGACSLAPKNEPALAPIPAAWPAQFQSESGGALTPNWQSFVIDEKVRGIVTQALAHNHDLRTALLNIEAARAQYRVQRAERLPNLDGQAQGTRQRLPGDLNFAGADNVQSDYRVGLGLAAFEIDLFGRVRNLSAAALQEYLATEEAARSVRISLIGEVLEAYLTADGALRRRQLTRETLETREQSLNLIKSRRQYGVVSLLDYQDAIALAEDARAQLHRSDREYRQALNALALLTGTGNDRGALSEHNAKGTIVSEAIAPGLPADLIGRRPDIRAAELRLLARNADIGAARAAFFPSISLTGSFGTASADFSDLFGSGSRAWTFVPQINIPIFRGGANKANLDLTYVRKDMAIVDYERTVQQAFREVADALDARQTLSRESQARRDLVDASSTGLKLAEARYRQGVDGFLRYLEAQRNSFTDRMGFIDASMQYQIALVRLFKSMGGSLEDQLLQDSGHRPRPSFVVGAR